MHDKTVKPNLTKPTLVYVSSPLGSSFAGGERYTQKMIKGLAGFEHIFVGSSKAMYQMFVENSCQSYLSSAGFEPVKTLNLLLAPLSVLMSLVQIIRFWKIFKQADWVVSPTSFTESFFLCPLLILLMQKKVMVIIHNNQCPRAIYANPLRFLLKWTMDRSQVVFVSEVQKKEWQAKGFGGFATNNSKISVIGYGLEKTKPLQINQPNNEQINIGFLGRIHTEKGIQTILKSLPIIAKSKPKNPKTNLKININIAGEGADKAELQNLQNNLGMDKNWQEKNQICINWVGFVADTDAFYQQQNLVVFPSLRESFGIVLLEGWAKGKPVLTSNIPVFKYLKNFVPKLEKELVFETENEQDLADKIMFFLNNRDQFQTQEYALELQKVLDENFSEQKMLKKYEVILN